MAKRHLRNCDIGTPDDQANRFHEFCDSQGGCCNCPCYAERIKSIRPTSICQFFWSQMTVGRRGLKLPVKDRETIPWMSEREIPAMKAALSEWRLLRKDKSKVAEIRKKVREDGWPYAYASAAVEVCAMELEKIAAIDERLKKEEKGND